MIRINPTMNSGFSSPPFNLPRRPTLPLVEYAYTQRGFSCLLIKLIASSTLFTVKIGRTGPKISFCMTGSDSATSVKTVGASDLKNKITAMLKQSIKCNMCQGIQLFIPIYFSASITCPPTATLPDLHKIPLVRLKISRLTIRPKLRDSWGLEP